ncbi:MAG: ATP-binding cassette domain-containing protein [Streptosporangiales bacterium]|nr:ATP-binding cassette domain-containing protein [Streptosporangiales bacterium]
MDTVNPTSRASAAHLVRRLTVLVPGALLLAWPLINGSPYILGLGIAIACYAMAAIGVDFAFGRAGLLSLGHGVYFGAGAYTAAVISQHSFTTPALVLVAAGAAVAAVLGLLLGAVFLRVGGYYFSVATLGAVFILASVLRGNTSLGGAAGLAGVNRNLVGQTPSTDANLYLVVAVVLALLIWSATSFGRTRMGRALTATREMPTAARVFGVPVFGVRLRAFTLSAAIAGVAGSFFAVYQQYVSPEVAGLNQSVQFLVMNVAGGLGTGWGPAVGALFIRGLPEVAAPLRDYQVLTQGVILVVVLLWLRSGLAGGLVQLLKRAQGALAARSLSTGAGAAPAAVRLPVRRVASSVLEVSGVTVRFGGLRAVDEVSLEVRSGRITGLIGPNGAGKSTMLNAISGLQKLSQGRITLDGADVSSLDARRRAYLGMSRTFQFVDLAPALSVIENVALGTFRTTRSGFARALVPGATRAEERRVAAQCLAALDMVGMAHLAHSTPKSLSAGQLRMLDVARALVSEPRVLLLDEPAAGLTDPEIDEFADCLESLRDDHGIALLLVEHDMRLVQRVCDHTVVVDAGRMLATGTPAEVINDAAVITAYLGTGVAS